MEGIASLGSFAGNNSSVGNFSASNGSNLSTIQDFRQRLKDCATKCDEPGRAYVSKVLTETKEDPWKTISDVQSRLSLGYHYPNITPLMQFLQSPVYSLSHQDIMAEIFQNLKDDLESKINLLDENALNLLLKESIIFLNFRELKVIPIYILKKMNKIPVNYLKILIDKNIIQVSKRSQSSLLNASNILQILIYCMI
jgi:hypothetical protein